MKTFIIVLGAILFSFNLLIALPLEVQAHSGRTTTVVCQDDLTGAIYFVPASGICDAGYTLQSVPGKYSQLCVSGPPYTVTTPISSGDAGGTLTCPTGSKLTTIKPAIVVTPGPTPSPNPNPNPNPNPSPNPNPNPTPGDSGNCGPEFIAKGPLCIPKSPLPSGGIGGCDSFGCVASKVISYLLGLAGIIAVIFVIIGGYYYMTARGNDAQAVSGRKTLVNALIGLAIVVLSFLIVQIATNFIVTGT